MFFQTCWNILTQYWPSFVVAIRTTLEVAIFGTVVGFVLGLLIGGFKSVRLDYTASKPARFFKKLYDVIANIYITVLRGTPMMIQALFFYYALLDVFHWDRMGAALFVISINTSAYMAEIIRSGIQSVDKGQTEAARSLGMSNAQTLLGVVLPQAVRNAFPALGNELIVNIKDSSDLMVISITELMFEIKSIAGTTFHYTESYFDAAMIYLVLNIIATLILNAIEKHMNKTPRVSLPMSDTDPKNVAFMKTESQEVHHD